MARTTRYLGSLVVIAVVLGLTVTQPLRAEAINGGEFDAGYIISDRNFFDSGSMDEGQVQAFIAGIRCSPAAGVPCLRDFRQNTRTVPSPGAGHCSQYDGEANESASRIIVKVARACGINPKVLLVLLQKEQSLLTNPSSYGYQRAMGWGCPDSGPNWSANCDANYFGFFNQTYQSAWQFRQYTLYPVNPPGSSGTRPYRIGTVYIQYHPNTACGGSQVNIRNQATANLYLYTPYQPNAAALGNLYGTGDGCSAYGNRNFWRLYYDWFGNPAGNVLSPVGNLEVGSASIDRATLRGWAFDPETASPIDVHLYVNGNWGGSFRADKARLDVAAAYPSYGPNHGFEISFAVPQGSFEACLYAINVGQGFNQQLGCRTISTPTGPPIGSIDAVSLTGRTATLSGWAIDPDAPSSIELHVYINGYWGGVSRADANRADVGRAYPGYGNAHGFVLSREVPVGSSQICVYAINVGAGYNQSIGCKTVSTASGPPFGNLEYASGSLGSINMGGWVIDPDTADPVDVHVYVDGRWGGAYRANVDRPDVGRTFAGYGAAHGFQIAVPVGGGTHTVCAFGINTGGGYNSALGCRSVSLPGGAPFGSIDSINGGTGEATLSGWALDPDTAASIDLHVYVDGAWGGQYKADLARPDVARHYPAYGEGHGYQLTVRIPPGMHQICVYGINVGAGYNSAIGCGTTQG